MAAELCRGCVAQIKGRTSSTGPTTVDTIKEHIHISSHVCPCSTDSITRLLQQNVDFKGAAGKIPELERKRESRCDPGARLNV